MSKHRVLLVDDEPSIREVVGKRLETMGYDVILAVDGQEALTKARIGRPDVILFDLMLPSRSGLEVCAELKRDLQHRHIPIIIFSAKGDAMDETLCREAGANASINKPRGTKALLDEVEVLLARFTRPSHAEGG